MWPAYCHQLANVKLALPTHVSQVVTGQCYTVRSPHGQLQQVAGGKARQVSRQANEWAENKAVAAAGGGGFPLEGESGRQLSK